MHFEKKLAHLSGDLELPFEDRLPGDSDFIEYRIGSDLNGAYVLYYFHDEVIFSSLLLSGTDELAETELMQGQASIYFRVLVTLSKKSQS